jgi:ArsR family transcriptional regulator, arsenate/arsenite/antimonite-responsive transcriptional repressor
MSVNINHAEQIQALADLTRLRLLNLLTQAKEICVCELVDALGLQQYAVSRHLHILAQAGFVEDRKVGKWVYYRIAPDLKPCQRTLLQAVGEMREDWPKFREDEERAARRLKLRRNGVCCVGIVTRISEAPPREEEEEHAWIG